MAITDLKPSLPKNSLRVQLAMTTAMAGVLFSYGGKQAYAGACTGGAGVYSCSGIANPGTDAQQNLNGVPGGAVSITTTAGFGIDTAATAAIRSQGINTAGISITDNNASTIRGSSTGIHAQQSGATSSGDITITSNGLIEGGSNGIYAFNLATGGNLQITANDVSGGFVNGIIASADNNIDITTNGTVTGNQRGIESFANTLGSGNNTIVINGSVTGTSAIGVGVVGTAYNGGSLSISVAAGGSVNGAQTGIVSYVNAASTAAITVSGTVTGGTRAGIDSNFFSTGGTTNITLNNGANVSATSGVAISNGIYGASNYDNTANVIVNNGAVVTGDINLGDGTDTATFNTGAAVNGAVNMGSGTDTITFNGGDFTNITTVDGGSGTDTMTITNGFVGTSGNIVNVENLTIGSGGTVHFTGALAHDTVAVQTGGTLSGGNLPIATNITGSLDLGVGSTVLAELGGTSSTQYDQIDVANATTLAAGAIFDVDFISGFSASLGEFFDIVIADSFIGDINDLIFDFSGAALGIGLGWEASFVAAGGSDEALRLTVVVDDTPVPGPSTILTLSVGLFGLYRLRRQRKHRSSQAVA
ncbi:MAG: hypothetical protein GKS01_10680 [Alphaproteobacteria bacterium]|nr:hypothetical protein [Alphaproteobacteria bacterium]